MLASLFARLRQAARLYEVEPQLAARFRGRQLRTLIHIVPLTVVANITNALLILAVFTDSHPGLALPLWCAAISVTTLLGLPAWLALRRGRLRPTASARTLRRVAWHATWLGALWGLMPILVTDASAEPWRQAYAWVVTAGMIAAGGHAMPTVPWGGTGYVSMLALGAAAAIAHSGFPGWHLMAALLALYAGIAIVSVWGNGRTFGRQLVHEAEVANQVEVIGLLLHEFEENASDVLWQTDAAGRLTHVTRRLIDAFGLDAADLERPIHRVLERVADTLEAEHAEALHGLSRRLRTDEPFVDHLILLPRAGERRWWLMRAKPVHDAAGTFAGFRGVAADVSAEQESKLALQTLAHHDSLTGLLNRLAFRRATAAALARLDRPGGSCALLCVDLDHFKTTNDTFGHAMGDALLVEVARRLQHTTRRGDVVARLGGDEFALALVDVADTAEAGAFVERLLGVLHEPFTHEGHSVPLHASIGVAMAPVDGRDLDTLLNHADLALYHAKAQGRACASFYVPQMAQQARRRMQLENALREALAHDQLSLEFQPQLRLADLQISGFEALLRWQHPELGTVSPAEFIPIAEETGLIRPIGEWVVDRACAAARHWPASLAVSVNVSPMQLAGEGLRTAVQRALHTHGLAPGRLELEITESVFLRETPTTIERLAQLHGLGVRVALDDFGTGYSSLAYLRRFPFDTLKIDRAFILELRTRADARAIVRTIVELARTLGFATVAEGVEDAEQLGTLQRLGCRSVQGHHLAPPMPASGVPGFLERWASRAHPYFQRPTPARAPEGATVFDTTVF